MLVGINPGQLDRRITLQSRTTAADAFNTPIETWSDLATVWAKVEYPSTGSDEDTASGLNVARRRVDFTIRHRTDVGFVERVRYSGGTYDIERIAELGRNDFLKLTTEERI